MLKANQNLIESKFCEASYKRIIWHAETEHGLTLKDICRPEYWAHVAYKLQRGNRIEVYPEDGSFYAELMVIFVPEKTPLKSANWAKVVPLAYVDLTKEEKDSPITELPAGFEVKWMKLPLKWCVVRDSDGAVIVEKQISKNDAVLEFFKKKNQLAA